MIKTVIESEERCPEQYGKAAFGENDVEIMDFCKLNDRLCLLVRGAECQIYNKWREENELET